MSSIPPVWIWLGIIACVIQSALFAGLTLAIFSLSQLRLQLEADAGKNAGARPCAMTGACDPEKPAPDLIRGGNRLSEKIMLRQKVRAPIDSI